MVRETEDDKDGVNDRVADSVTEDVTDMDAEKLGDWVADGV